MSGTPGAEVPPTDGLTPGTPHPEIPLSGGRLTPGVVRVGDTVRRPKGPSSPFVAALLAHLEQKGFHGAPRHLGTDESGRDVFEYLPGWVPARFRRWRDDTIAAAGALLRGLHDATRDSPLKGAHPVVCHHDPGPNNAVFGDGVPVAFIDFDMAAPGDPLEDLGYAAWTWCVSGKPGAPPPGEQARQVRVLADAYGLTGDREGLLGAILDRQERNTEWWRARLGEGPETPGRIGELIAWSASERRYTHEHREAFLNALSDPPGCVRDAGSAPPAV